MGCSYDNARGLCRESLIECQQHSSDQLGGPEVENDVMLALLRMQRLESHSDDEGLLQQWARGEGSCVDPWSDHNARLEPFEGVEPVAHQPVPGLDTVAANDWWIEASARIFGDGHQFRFLTDDEVERLPPGDQIVYASLDEYERGFSAHRTEVSQADGATNAASEPAKHDVPLSAPWRDLSDATFFELTDDEADALSTEQRAAYEIELEFFNRKLYHAAQSQSPEWFETTLGAAPESFLPGGSLHWTLGDVDPP